MIFCCVLKLRLSLHPIVKCKVIPSQCKEYNTWSSYLRTGLRMKITKIGYLGLFQDTV